MGANKVEREVRELLKEHGAVFERNDGNCDIYRFTNGEIYGIPNSKRGEPRTWLNVRSAVRKILRASGVTVMHAESNGSAETRTVAPTAVIYPSFKPKKPLEDRATALSELALQMSLESEGIIDEIKGLRADYNEQVRLREVAEERVRNLERQMDIKTAESAKYSSLPALEKELDALKSKYSSERDSWNEERDALRQTVEALTALSNIAQRKK